MSESDSNATTAPKAFFISVEGGEGLGKTLLMKQLQETLSRYGYPVLATREPGGCASAESIRSLFLAPPTAEAWTQEAEYLLLAAARAQHYRYTIAPALKQGSLVLCDRFLDSSIVYQGLLWPDCDWDWLLNVHRGLLGKQYAEQHPEGLLPDLTLLLQAPPEISMQRLSLRAQSEALNRFDLRGREFHEQLAAAYAQLAARFPQRICTLDASLNPAQVLDQALRLLQERLDLGPRKAHN